MKAYELIRKTPGPVTRSSLRRQIAEAGVHQGSTVLVHSSLSAFGWVAGGAAALIHALLDAVGQSGTVVMPAHSAQLTDPALWDLPEVPAGWLDAVKAEMPAFDPLTTPTHDIGAVAELFRTWPGTLRSAHPATSFAALGKHAGQITADHALTSPLGEQSPLARLYDMDAIVLLLGVGFDACTMLHLAEHRAWPDRPAVLEGSPIMEDGERRWVTYQVPPYIDAEHFVPLTRFLHKGGVVRKFAAGNATSMLMSARQLVDAVVENWRYRNPPAWSGGR